MKMIYLMFLIILALLFSVIMVYVLFSPQFGAGPTVQGSDNYVNGKFTNLVDTPMQTGNKSMSQVLYESLFKKNKNASPKNELPSKSVDISLLDSLSSSDVAITWFGHSTVLFSIKGLNVLADPIFGKRIPPPGIGPKAFKYDRTFSINDLPEIDVVIISHDHYDHLDMETIQQLSGAIFYVPLGVKAHLLRWGIDESRVEEFDWYQEKNHSKNLKLVFTPSRHFSGRGFSRDKTLWGSWVIKLNNKSIYFGGDSGYFNEFKKIGDLYGPYDLALLENGRYGESWANIHMLPKETVQAGIDLKAKVIMPIHNSKYTLANHAWDEPLKLLSVQAKKKGVSLTTPLVGDTFILGDSLPVESWWVK